MLDIEYIVTCDNIIWMYIPEAEEWVKTDFKLVEEDNNGNNR